jgi:hypothetical protein
VGAWAMEAGVRLVRAFTTHALVVLGTGADVGPGGGGSNHCRWGLRGGRIRCKGSRNLVVARVFAGNAGNAAFSTGQRVAYGLAASDLGTLAMHQLAMGAGVSGAAFSGGAAGITNELSVWAFLNTRTRYLDCKSGGP